MARLDPRSVCVLLPAFNEEKNISQVVAAVRSQGYSVLCVDDGSKDHTAAQAEKAGAEVLILKPNHGKGGALKAGIVRFLDGPLQALVVMDADGQHDPADLPRIIEPIAGGRADVVIGDRMGDTHAMPFIRIATNRFMSFLLSSIARQRISDTQCGYRAYTRAAIEKIRIRTNHFEVESEMLLEAARHGFRIASMPVRSVYEGGPSRIRPAKDTLRFFSFLVRYLATKKK